MAVLPLLKRLYCPSHEYEMRPRCNRWVYFIAAILQVVFVAGLVFGWASLEQILKREGYFDEDCSEEELAKNDCDSRTLKLSNVFLAGSISAFAVSPVSGYIIDKCGPRAATTLGAVFVALFFVFMGIAEESRPEWLFPAFICLGIETNTVVFSTFSTGNLFPSYASTIISTISGSFDAATVVFLVWNSLSKNQGIALDNILTVYASTVGVLVMCSLLFLWPSRPFGVPTTPTKEEKPKAEEQSATAAATITAPSMDSALSLKGVHRNPVERSTGGGTQGPEASTVEDPPSFEHDAASATVDGGSTSVSRGDSAKEGTDESTGSAPASQEDEAEDLGPDAPPQDSDVASAMPGANTWHSPEAFKRLPFSKQIRSPEAIAFICWQSVSLLKSNYMFGSIDSQLTKLGQVNGEYTDIFGIIIVAGTVAVPFLGMFMGRFGYPISAWALWGIGLAMHTCMAIPSLNLQILTFVLFVLFRGWLFAFMGAYVSHAFGFGTFSRVVGTATVIGACVSFLQYPLIDLALETFEGDYLVSNLVVIVLNVLLVFFPLTLSVMSRKRSPRAQKRYGTVQVVVVHSCKARAAGEAAHVATSI